ncbi:uncharacterized protein VTP21DRAFT_9150 [Calcarisporiella thermophila]|uniref:uncharacterized protein n=1 Tax=Calcarisporiella thermophila TaxID=911321 RepID=UPI0037444A0C
MGYIRQEQLRNLRLYKYDGVDHSILSRYVLGPYWDNLVKLFPLSVSPNMITLLGLCAIIINLLTLYYYSPDSKESCPSWVYFSFAIGLFIYQSFDAIDGKQARRTGTSGPLGELFDHGCDALNTTLEGLICIHSLNIQGTWWAITSLLLSTCNFYLTTWEEYYTGTLYLSVFSGPVEGIVMIICIHTCTGLYGRAFWENDLNALLGLSNPWLPRLQLNHALLLFGAIGVIFNVVAAIKNVLKSRRHPDLSHFARFKGLIPFAFLAVVVVVWLNASPSILQDHFLPFALYYGLTLGYMVGAMILAYLMMAPFPLNNVLIWPLVAGATNANLPYLLSVKPLFAGRAELVYLYTCLIAGFVLYFHFAISVINEICAFCDINCLTVKKKSDANRS